MKLLALVVCVAGFATTMKAIPFCTVSPGTYCEKSGGDAGSSPATSEPTIGVGELDFIIGKINNGTSGVDMFSILIPDPSSFFATFTEDTNGGNTGLTDAALFLFDGDGNGIEAADDGSPALGAFAGPAGFYYIAIAPDGDNPQYKKAGNDFLIFSAFSASVSLPVSGAKALANFSKNGCGTDCEGGYEISFEGADFSNLPEPASMALTGLALAALGALGRARRKRMSA